MTFRDLIECGTTWNECADAGTPIDNLPREAETLEALRRLCTVVLDPVIDVFGSIELVYGLACRELSNKIARTTGRVAPARA